MATPIAPSQPKTIISFFSKQASMSSSSSSSSSSGSGSSANSKKTLSWSTPYPEQLADRLANAKSSPAKKGAVKATKAAVKPKAPKADKVKKDKVQKAVPPVDNTKVNNTPIMDLSIDDPEEDTPQVKNSPIAKNPLQKLFQATPSSTVKPTLPSGVKDDVDSTVVNTDDTENNNTELTTEESAEQAVVDLSTQNVDNQPVENNKKAKKVTKKREKKEPKAKTVAAKKSKDVTADATSSNNDIIDISNETDGNAASSEAVDENVVDVENLDANAEISSSSEQGTVVVGSSTPSVKKTPASDVKKRSSREKKPSAKAVKSEEQIEMELLENLSPEVLATISIRKDKIMTLANEIVTLEEANDFNDVHVDVTSSIDSLIATALSYGLHTSNVQQITEEAINVTENKTENTMEIADVADVENAEQSELATNELVEESSDVIASETIPSSVTEHVAVAEVESSNVIASETEPSSAAEQVAAVGAPQESADPVDVLKESLTVVLVRAIQGSSKPLQALIGDVANILSTIPETLDASITQATSEISAEGPRLLKEMLQKISDSVTLGEEIKTLAAREAYGIRRKNAEIYDCVEKQAIWRWNVHVHSIKRFTKNGLKIIHDIIAVRKMYGKLIKAHHDVIKALERIPYDSVKISAAEEKAAKATGEYEKAKEKRREMEQKKLEKLADKNREKSRKQEEQELKKREREEAAAKKAAEKDAETKEKEREKKEKEQRLLQEKEKKEMEAKKTAQKFQGFFKPSASASKSSKSSSEVIDISNEKITTTVKSSSFDNIKFEDSLKANMTMNDIIISNRERYREHRKKSKKSYRSKKVLSVMVANTPSAFGAESYSELKEVKVDGRMRLLSFYEDTRPAYFGTISKKSKISGRRPFEQDHELLNYDFDSEGEWEEDDGEDIEDSDGDDEEGANELEYDDFFRHDDDFGSDVDDDGDVVAAVAIQKREGEEILGPTFLRSKTTAQIAMRFEEGKCIEISQPEKEKSVVRLRMYSAVVFNQDIDITEALESSTDKKAKETKEKKDKKAAKKVAANEAAVGQTASSVASEVVATATATAGAPAVKPKAAKRATSSLFTDELTITLINEVHNKKLGLDKLIQEFLEKHPDLGIEKSVVKKKINEVAEKKKTESGGFSNIWTVKSEFEIKYNLQLPTLDIKVKRKRSANKPKDQQTKISLIEKSPGVDKHCEAILSSSSSDDPVELVSILELLESPNKKARTDDDIPITEKNDNVCMIIDADDNKENILNLDLDEDMVI